MSSDAAKQLEKISQFSGSTWDLTQGGGGNTSVKTPNQMLIKASGFRLDEVFVSQGYSKVRPELLNEFFSGPEPKISKSEQETASNQLLKVATLEGELRPSMESGFHAVLGPLVTHTHSIYTNVLACAKEGQDIFNKQDWPIKVTWVCYVSPGCHLSRTIAGFQQNAQSVFILANHGLIVSGLGADEVIAKHQQVTDFIIKQLKLKRPPLDYKINVIENGHFKADLSGFNTEFNMFEEACLHQEVLFPDQFIYFKPAINQTEIKVDVQLCQIQFKCSAKKAQALLETYLAYCYIRSEIERLGLTCKWLSQEDLDYLISMDSEKYRQKLSN